MEEFEWREPSREVYDMAQGIISFMIGIQHRVPSTIMIEVFQFRDELERSFTTLLKTGNIDKATEFMEYVTTRGTAMTDLIKNTGKYGMPAIH
jgi:hypothetical protein